MGSLLLQCTFPANWMWQQIWSQETIQTPWNGSWLPSHFWEFINWGEPRDNLFTSRLSHQVKTYFFVETRSTEPSSRCLLTKFVPQGSLCIFPILHDPKGFEQSPERQSTYMMILVPPAWQPQLWYPEAMRMFIQQSILLTWRRDLLKNPKGSSRCPK